MLEVHCFYVRVNIENIKSALLQSEPKQIERKASFLFF